MHDSAQDMAQEPVLQSHAAAIAARAAAPRILNIVFFIILCLLSCMVLINNTILTEFVVI